MRWPMQATDGAVLVEDGVGSPRPMSGEWLAANFLPALIRVTFGLVTLRERSLSVGPVELLRFGEAEVGRGEVSWPIDGGLLAAGPAGRLRAGWADGRLEARVEGYRPALPLPVYALTQLPLHHALVRLQLLRLRGRLPAAGVPAEVTRRAAAGFIDAAICATIALAVARKRRLRAFAAIAAGYHVAAWTASGKTAGGAVMRLRVVAVDGSRPSLPQAMLRCALLPLAALRLRAVHDDIAGTDVIAE
jgi:hypothetical protein